MKRQALVTAVFVTLLLAGCTDMLPFGSNAEKGASLTTFKQTNAQCSGSAQHNATADLSVQDTGAISTIQGTVQTSTPCHAVNGTLVQTGENAYELQVTTVPPDGACVQCVGAATYRATVTFTTDTGALTVTHDGDQVAQTTY